MKLGLFAMNYGTCAEPEQAVRVARHAEAAGFESLWVGEHVVLPDPQPERFWMPPTLPFLDPIIALTLLAAETERVRLATGIIELPLHEPVLLAKQLASLDQVSEGRLIVGIGAGYLRPEFDAVGVDLDERGPRMDEHLAAMRALWTMEHPAFAGRFVRFSGVDAHPRPVAPNGPPIVMGGVSAPARRRVIRDADGWYCFQTTPEWAAEAMAVIHDEQQRVERAPHLGPIEVTVTPIGPFDRSVCERYEALGVDRLVFLPGLDPEPERRHAPVPIDEILRTIDRVATTVG